MNEDIIIGFIISGIIIVGFILFCVYFIFKQFQFVLVSVNLYKKMVSQQDSIIKILLDIRDHTKNYNRKQINEKTKNILNNEIYAANRDDAIDESFDFCYHCGTELKKNMTICPKCGMSL